MSVVEKIKNENQSKIIEPKKSGLLVENPVYKPFRYPWCYDAWLTQQRIHWSVSNTQLTLPKQPYVKISMVDVT